MTNYLFIELMIEKSEEAMHAENLWKYLDELSQNNPEEYKKFISYNLKQGKEIFKGDPIIETKEQKIKQEILEYPNKFSSEEEQIKKMFNLNKKQISTKEYLCLNYKIKNFKKIESQDILTIDKESKIDQKDLTEIPKTVFSINWPDQLKNVKLVEEPKIYLNIIESDEFYPPLNSINNEELEYIKWNYIPSLFRHAGDNVSQKGFKQIFFECIIHSRVVNVLKSNEKSRAQILSHLSVKFNIFISDYCDLYLNNVRIVSKHSYYSVKNKPDAWSLEETNKNVFKPKPSNITENIPYKNFYEENKIKIPSISENYPGEKTFYNLPKENKKERPLITEIDSHDNKNDDKKPIKSSCYENRLSTEKKQIVLVAKEIIDQNKMKLIFQFEGFHIISFENVDLQISKKEIKIQIENLNINEYTPIYLSFDKFDLNPDLCEAKFMKKAKTLALIIYKN